MFWLHGRSRQSSSWADEGTAGGPRFKNASDRKAAREMKSGGLPVVSPRGSHSSVLVACWLALTLATVHAQSPSNAPFVVPDTAFPSTSVEPTSFPSSSTAGDGSTGTPSSIPSDMPSDMPSNSPTPQPSLEEPSLASARFRQEFAVGNGRLFTESEIVLFQGLYGSYTSAFAPSSVSVDDEIISECEFLSQKLAERALSVAARHHHFTRSRQLQQSTLLQVDFNMVYASPYTNVSAFPLLFQSYVNAGLEQVAQQMQILGLNVSAAFIASRIIIRPDPTVQPTIAPSLQPSLSHSPSGIPSDMATLEPSSSTVPSASAPSSAPTMNPAPNQQGPKEASKGSGKIVISISVVVAMIIVMIGLFVYYRKKKNDRKLAFQSSAPGNRKGSRDDTVWDHSSQKQVDNEAGNHTEAQLNVTTSHKRTASAKSASRTEAIILHNDSLVSNQSLLSTGDSKAEDSGDEVDATHYLADEFDQYKDQNLEKMRAGVEGNLTGFDGMMSQALTRALIDEDDSNIDPTELLWGGSGRLLGAEIEASALGEVTDWLKRKQAPTDDERRLFMQETLNKMVASVRHGVLGPEEASRSIHECAALLGLQLATEIPVTTLIITGMRKTVTARDMIDAFAEFGDIAEAAVASNQRGFGILRFKSNHSVDRAIKKFRTEEIVVQDVAVQVKVLRPGSTTASVEEDLEPSAAGILP